MGMVANRGVCAVPHIGIVLVIVIMGGEARSLDGAYMTTLIPARIGSRAVLIVWVILTVRIDTPQKSPPVIGNIATILIGGTIGLCKQVSIP